jgi:hypothetical protein
MNIIYYYIFITFLFIVWSEYSVTNILFRENSLGSLTINLNSLFGFLTHPFYNSTLWNMKTLDINYLFILIVSSIFFFLLYV